MATIPPTAKPTAGKITDFYALGQAIAETTTASQQADLLLGFQDALGDAGALGALHYAILRAELTDRDASLLTLSTGISIEKGE